MFCLEQYHRGIEIHFDFGEDDELLARIYRFHLSDHVEAIPVVNEPDRMFGTNAVDDKEIVCLLKVTVMLNIIK